MQAELQLCTLTIALSERNNLTQTLRITLFQSYNMMA
jgi:hypothetical protein